MQPKELDMRKILIIFLIVLILPAAVFSAGQQDGEITTIVFGDNSWDSIQVHNRIAAFIIENGFEGYKADYMPGDSIPLFSGLIQGDVDVNMESWHSNMMEIYIKGTESGDVIDLGQNMPDAPQGWWVPRYLVEGPDAKAPNLKSIADLPQYADLFADPEDKSKGIIYGGVAGWGQLEISEAFYEKFGLEETFNMGVAGSGSVLAASMVGAYEKKEAWCGYYWAPTPILGTLDMIRLKGSEFEPAIVNILVNKSMLEKAPDVVEFLKAYATSVAVNNEFLAKMAAEDWDTQQTAEWFLKNKEDVWTEWVSSEVSGKVKAALASL